MNLVEFPAKNTNMLSGIRKYLAVYGLKELLWLIVFFLLLLPESIVQSVDIGLDPSWKISINYAIQKGLIFGKDYIFTYGPLGIFYTKQAVVVNKIWILCFELFVLGCSIFILRIFLKKSGYHTLAYVIILASLFLLRLSNQNLLYLVTPITIFFILYFIKVRHSLFLFLAALMAVIGFYIKVNYGIVLMVLLNMLLVFSVIYKLTNLKNVLYVFVVQCLLMGLLSILLNVNLYGYVVSSLHLISAYNDAMFWPIYILDVKVILSFVIILLFIGGFVVKFKSYFNLMLLSSYACSSLLLFLLFKNGFVRADAHTQEFFKIATVSFGIMFLFSEGVLNKIWTVLTCCVLVLSYWGLWDTIRNEGQYVFANRMQYIGDAVNDVTFKNTHGDYTNYYHTIPEEYIKTIGNHSVDIMPWDISEVYYYKLNYNPRPVVQTYSAYDEYLDTKNYEKYISSTAPDYIIYTNKTIDGRYPFWDESITKRALFTNYELITEDSIPNDTVDFDEEKYLSRYKDVKEAVDKGHFKSGYEHYILFGKKEGRYNIDYILLKKRTTPLTLTAVKEEKVNLQIGQEYTIRESDNLQFLYANVQYTAAGKMQRLFFQPPELYVQITYKDGTHEVYKAIVPILKTGVLITQRVENTFDAAVFFNSNGTRNQKIKSIQFIASKGFNPVIECVIKEMKIK